MKKNRKTPAEQDMAHAKELVAEWRKVARAVGNKRPVLEFTVSYYERADLNPSAAAAAALTVNKMRQRANELGIDTYAFIDVEELNSDLNWIECDSRAQAIQYAKASSKIVELLAGLVGARVVG